MRVQIVQGVFGVQWTKLDHCGPGECSVIGVGVEERTVAARHDKRGVPLRPFVKLSDGGAGVCAFVQSVHDRHDGPEVDELSGGGRAIPKSSVNTSAIQEVSGVARGRQPAAVNTTGTRRPSCRRLPCRSRANRPASTDFPAPGRPKTTSCRVGKVRKSPAAVVVVRPVRCRRRMCPEMAPPNMTSRLGDAVSTSALQRVGRVGLLRGPGPASAVVDANGA